MEKAASLCIMVLLATAVVNSVSTAVHESIPAAGRGRDRGLTNGHFMKRATGFWVSEDGRKSITAGGKSMVADNKGDNKGTNAAAATSAVMMSAGRREEEEHKFVEKDFKFCLTSGPCHKKKLVCPKKCTAAAAATTTTTSGGRSRVENLHIPGQCIFDCNKCVAQCAS